MQEIWKDIEFYEGYYQVSNLGNVKSLARTVPFRKSFNYSTGIFYNGINDLLDSFDFKKSTIMSKLNGQRKNDTTFKYV